MMDYQPDIMDANTSLDTNIPGNMSDTTNYPEPKQLTVYSLVYHPSVDLTTLEDANIGIFPANLIPPHEIATGSNPFTYMVLGEEEVNPLYVIGHEFSAQDQTCYLPKRLLNDGFIQEGGKVTVSLVELPAVTRMVLEPETDGFAQKTIDPKADLETVIVGKYQVISKNDTIIVNGEILTITELEPSDVVSTHNSDPTVEFLPSKETNRREFQEEQERQKIISEEECQKKRNEELLPKTSKPVTDEWLPFSGIGRRLDGSLIPNSDIIPNSSESSSSNRKPGISITNREKYQSFAGNGNRLGSD